MTNASAYIPVADDHSPQPAHDDVRERFEAYLTRLTASLEARSEVIGLVLCGSTADRDRVDKWSDHDFLVVTASLEIAQNMRDDLSWLPDAERIVLAPHEGVHGLKVVYDDGRVLEFAVFGPDELGLAIANSYEVAIDRADLAATMRDAAARPRPGAEFTLRDRAELFLSLLLIGVGRHRRGETLTAGQFVRSHALAHVLALHRVAHASPSPTSHGIDPRLDDLDPYRRVERVHPVFGAAVAAAIEADPETAARRLLELAHAEGLADAAHWPHDGEAAVRRRLGWSPAPAQ